MTNRVLITGVCGFVGHALAERFRRANSADDLEIIGVDNLVRPGVAVNQSSLKRLGVRFLHADVRLRSDLEGLPRCDWVIDAAANASVLAGTAGHASSRQLVETNLKGTIELLELCRQWDAGLMLLSTSRVYSLRALSELPVRIEGNAYHVDADQCNVPGVGRSGVAETFSTQPPVSLYGATKLASELLAQEYSSAFGYPVLINRCGVIAGAGQFGRADQGIFSFWLHSWRARRPLKMIGFDGEGYQVRDCLHPDDLYTIVERQMSQTTTPVQQPVCNVSGGLVSATSLRQLSMWCRERWGDNPVGSIAETRVFDVPWLVLDSSLAGQLWDWQPMRSIDSILTEIAEFAETNPNWMDVSAG